MKKYSQFHDGSFEGFWIDGTTVHVYLSTLEKERFTVVNEGVVAVAAGGFRAGNIVFDVVSRNHKEITLRDIEELYDLREGPAGESQGMRQLGKAQKEELTLFEISPSYGATCMVLLTRSMCWNEMSGSHVTRISAKPGVGDSYCPGHGDFSS